MNEKNNSISSFIKGIFISFGLTIILFYILGMLLSYTTLPESIINPAIMIITGISILIGASIVTIKSNKKGFIKGALVGLLYFGLIYFSSSVILKNFQVNIYSIIMFLVAFLCGSIGGIVGINLKK